MCGVGGRTVTAYVLSALHRFGQAQLDLEFAAMSCFTVCYQAAAHQFHQLTRNGKAQAGAAKFLVNVEAGLREVIEQVGQGCGVNADASVLDGELNAPVPIVLSLRPGYKRDRSLMGELDGVCQQVGQDLSNARFVTQQGGGQIWSGVPDQLKLFCMGQGAVKLHDIAQQAVQVQWLYFNVKGA